jgi:hypothetical protein
VCALGFHPACHSCSWNRRTPLLTSSCLPHLPLTFTVFTWHPRPSFHLAPASTVFTWHPRLPSSPGTRIHHFIWHPCPPSCTRVHHLTWHLRPPSPPGTRVHCLGRLPTLVAAILAMANSIETNSTESGKAKALDKSVQKGANASARPFKKIKKLSTGASTPPIYSCSSTMVSSSSDSQSNGSEPEAIELTPQEALEALQKHWRSPIYTFFKSEVVFQYHEGQPSHFFACTAPKCKVRAGGVRRYQDSKDKSSTANLKHHALRCFGADAVNAAIAGKEYTNGSRGILALFARKSKQPYKYLHRVHTNPEVRVHLFKWLTENNRPINIINDRELRELLTAGRPSIQLPTNPTISCDIHMSFEKCQV